MKKYAFCVLILLISFSFDLAASQVKSPSAFFGTIKGQIKDKDTKELVKGDILVRLGVSGPNGKPTVFIISGGDLNQRFITGQPHIFIIVEKEGYKPYKGTFETKEVIEVDIFLERLPEN
jgi:hypothetical protein